MTAAAEFKSARKVEHGFGTGRPEAKFGAARSFAGTSTSWFQVAYDVGGEEEITKPYQQSVWVHAALKVLADAASSVRPVLWQSDDENAKEVPESDPVSRLFQRPNPIMSRATLMAASMIHRKLDGEDFWFLADKEGEPLEVKSGKIDVPSQIIPVRGGLVEAVWKATKQGVNGGAKEKRRQIGWRYAIKDGGKSPTFPMESVVHFRDYDPYDMRRGLGDVEVLSRSLNVQFQAERYQEGVLRNSGDPGGFVVYENTLQPKEQSRLEQAWNDIQGNPENRGAMKVLDQGAKYIPNSISPRDMEFTELRSYGRSETLAALGVPPPLVSIFDDATYNNISTAERMLWTGGNGVLSFLRSVQDTLDAFFFRNLRDPKAQKYVLRFDVGSVKALQEDNTDQIEAAGELVAKGIGISMNEGLAMHNVEVEPPKNGDARYLDPSLQPVGEDGAPLNGTGAAVESANGENSTTGEDTTDPAAAPSSTAADGTSIEGVGGLSLNGAQIQAVKDIVADVAQGVLPRDSGKGLLITLFGLTDEQAESMLGSAGDGSKTKPNTPEGGAQPVADETEETGEEGDDSSEDEPARTILNFDQLTELRSTDAKAWRLEYWRRLDSAVLTPGETAIKKAAGKFLRDYFDAQIKRLRAVASGAKNITRPSKVFEAQRKDVSPSDIATALLLDQEEWIGKMEKALGPRLSEVYANALRDAVSDIGGIQVAVADPRIVAALSAQEIKLTEGVTSTLAKKVRDTLVEALSDLEGVSTATVQQAVAEALPELEGALKASFTDVDSRALAIARTETGQAANTARYLHMEENDVEEHEWISSADTVVRESHSEPLGDGAVVPIGQPFPNGLRRPHDPAAPASEVVNCRCSTAAVVKVPTPSEG